MSAMTNVQEEEDAVGRLINANGKELEWDPGRSNRRSLDSSCCCHVCGKKFLKTRALQRHQRTHTGAKPHTCSHCGTAFSVLKRHHLIHTKERAFSCPVCDKRFSRKDKLKEHLSIHGCSAKAKEAAEALGGVETADTTISSDTSHLEIKSAGKFTNMAALEDRFPHPEGAQSSVDICFCHLCWTQFSEKQLLEGHLKQAHESKKPFSCTQCGKRFMYVPKLKEHEAGHEGLKPHQCPQCNKGFQTSKGLENHMRDHTGEKPFPCITCGKRFKQESTLRAHYVTHSGERPHLCSICGKRYARAEELKVHLRVHTGEKPYQCDDCGKSFYYRQGFNNHKKTHSAKPIEPTRQLGRPRQMGSTRKSSRPRKISQRAPPDSDGEDLTWEPPELGNRPLHHHDNQETHAAENHSQTSVWNGGHYTAFIPWDQNPNMSHWCAAAGHQAYGAPAGASINSSALLRGTVEQEHFKESCPAEQPSWPSGTSSVSPSEPGLTTLLPHNTKSKKMHLSEMGAELNHHEEHRPETQDQDDRTEPTEETLKGPEPESSSNEQPQEKPSEGPKQCRGLRRLKKNYNCPTCGKVFSHNPALQRHLVIHSGKRPFKCFICGRGFTQSGNLKTHMKVHKGELPNWTLVQETSPPKESPVTVHVCGECGMDFPQKQQLEAHCQSHKKPYACPDCGKTFKNKYYFKIHKRIHSGDSPFLCSECGKSCVTADSLKKHELTHTGEKNFHCDQCGRAFSQSSHLNVHLKTHTGERPYLCSICGKSYSKASHLKVHLRVHTGDKPYTCEKCGKCFYYSQGYRKHLMIHDKKPKPPAKPLGRPKQ